MTILKYFIYAGLLVALIWSVFQDKKTDKALKDAKAEHQALKDTLR